jgi:Uma2 family endonuclease
MARPDAMFDMPPWPAVDDQLAEPETRYEVRDGELVHVSPAHAPHAIRHSKISALVEAHAASDFDVASDMLTRTSADNDFAPDVSVFPSDRDPITGGRQLEHLAFEVVATQSLGNAGEKAAELTARGVRRVFAIDVDRERALEWSTALGTWRMLDPSGHIADVALAVPLPLEALVRAAKADNAMARALVAKNNPVIAQNRAEGHAEGEVKGRAEGELKGRAESVLELLAARGIAPIGAERARILGERDPGLLSRWLVRAVSCATVAEIFAEPDAP